MSLLAWVLVAAGVLLLAVAVYDVLQTKHTILRNFPIIGHFRYLLEAVGPELRQYIVTDNDEERPFSRDQRSWIYASAKGQNNYFGFGTDNDLELSPHHLLIRHSAFPLPTPHHPAGPDEGDDRPRYPLPAAKILGGWRDRARQFRPASVINISGMSFGSLSGAAVEAMNRGAARCGCLHNTGEGGVADHHRHGGELIWQIGTGYFGCRDGDGRFSKRRFLEEIERTPTIRAIEIKLSQGAKPGLGGVLPAAKISPEIQRVRGIEDPTKDIVSPAAHSAFDDVPSMVDFLEDLADSTGLPVGIKSAVGELAFWERLADHMATTGRGPDFIAIDGAEGGTGAAPLTFTDHVALPFKLGFSRVYSLFAGRGLHDQVVWIGSGRLGFPAVALLAFGLGCDLVHVGREAMMAVGCIQAQRCHTDHCPTGVATQNRWLVRGLEPVSKGERLAGYVTILRKELQSLSRACGVTHPALITLEQFEFVDDRFGSRGAREVFGYEAGWGRPSPQDREAIGRLMDDPEALAEAARPGRSA